MADLMTSDRRTDRRTDRQTDGRTHKQFHRPTYVVRTWVNDHKITRSDKKGKKKERKKCLTTQISMKAEYFGVT